MQHEIKIVVQSEEPDIAVATEDGRDGGVAGLFEAPLEALVGARRTGGRRADAGMAVKVPEEAVSLLIEANEQLVCGCRVARDADHGASVVGEGDRLAQNPQAVRLGAGHKEELLVRIGREIVIALLKKQRADDVSWRCRGRSDDPFAVNGLERADEVVHEA